MIDLRSDTVTRPTEAMREAARDATVGDDVYGEDPTVNELEATAAEKLGTDTALFVPSGTMGNQLAIRVHTDRGEELICERNAHVFRWEVGGPAQHSAVQTRPITGNDRGRLTAEQIRNAIIAPDDHHAGTGLLALENTHNARGGTALSVDAIREPARAAHDRDVSVHLDGARLFNAAVARDRPVADFVDPVDSVMCCLSKGLGAPVGSILAGPASFIDEARRIRKLFGGGMRQAGIIGAPGLEALSNVDQLAGDHRRAERLAAGLDAIEGLSVSSPETNIVLVTVDEPAEQFLERCADAGVRGVPFGDRVVRFCTHRDISDEDVDQAIDAIAEIY